MIITRTPLRISLGGGGTDLPSYYRHFGGFVLSAAINKYVYVSINQTFFPGYFLKYSKTELAESYDAIRHPAFREALRLHQMPCHIEISSIADVPAGTGLGSSGSFLVGLLQALHAYKREPITAEAIAEEAFDIEVNRLGQPVGKQDQYIAAYGGLICQEYRRDESVAVSPLNISETALRELRDSLMLFFVGYTRNSADLLDDQKRRSEGHDAEMLENLHFVKQVGAEIKLVLEAGNIGRLGELMHDHWMRKRTRSASMTNDRIDELYKLARSHGGATGGKLVGAGGSGFLLFHTNDRRRLRATMLETGLSEMDFSFDFDGSVVLLRDR
jgi:D-glycero-alpha-D-manno-heptose-7-phosphate kinase